MGALEAVKAAGADIMVYGTDGNDDAVVPFVGVQIARTEDHGKHRQSYRDPHCRHVKVGLIPRDTFNLRKDCKRQRDRLQLQCDIWRARNHRNYCDDHPQLGRLAKPRGHQVCD